MEFNFLFIVIKLLKVAGVIFLIFLGFLGGFLGLYFFAKFLISFCAIIVAGVSLSSTIAVADFIAVATEAIRSSILLFSA